jgi:hypothetical protein
VLFERSPIADIAGDLASKSWKVYGVAELAKMMQLAALRCLRLATWRVGKCCPFVAEEHKNDVHSQWECVNVSEVASKTRGWRL